MTNPLQRYAEGCPQEDIDLLKRNLDRGGAMAISTTTDLRNYLDPIMGSEGCGDPDHPDDPRGDSDAVLLKVVEILAWMRQRDDAAPDWGDDEEAWGVWVGGLDLWEVHDLAISEMRGGEEMTDRVKQFRAEDMDGQ